MIIQLIIGATGLTALWLVLFGKTLKQKLFGSYTGLAGQPFWIMSSWSGEQYGILILSLAYTFVWGRSIVTYRQQLKGVNYGH
jgi:hypothetical protein